MNKKTLTLATRDSALALWQTKHVAAAIESQTDFQTKLLPMTTEGDRRLEVTLSKLGGKGLFLKELEQAMLAGDADIAVHSMKDVPAKMPAEFQLCAVFERADPSDAFVSNHYRDLKDLPEGAVVGTSSLRRQAQLLSVRPDLQVKPLRGNVNSRLQKLDDGQYAAIVLASAGLIRLGFEDRIASRLMAPQWLPAVSQGAIGVECLASNTELAAALSVLNHADTWLCIRAERALNLTLEGSCSVAIGAYAEALADHSIHLKAAVFSPDGEQVLTAQQQGYDPESLGRVVAEDLLSQGAKEVLALSEQA
ncbi:hydroxymethylbilane synthase [Marinicella gelatinilytica]|uniref:hydroxymethylbilane synthase n=1 Tax=Marinicella gelatinilytica TaxID=2996017 RepID=UPI00226097E0|nr:hydroxymethylbilane synthase [Marinicella gelatinilytica]MCX7544930.1 hydroxymethylbilane synthase [Marinicella gelatinilytica]